MSSERFTDELLSAIIDGQTDDATVAAANADPVASQRLAAMRTAAGFVAEEPAPATAERRQQSIAAALAVATPAPEVTSLTTKREEKRKASWDRSGLSPALIAVAAALFLFVVVGVASLRGGSDSIADVASDVADESSLTADAADAAADVVDSDDEEEAMEDDEEAMEDEEAFEEEEAMEDEEEEAMEDDESDDSAVEETADEDVDEEEEFVPETAAPQQERTLNELLTQDPPALPSTNSIDGINDLISLGSITAQFSIDDLLEAGVNPDCLNVPAQTSVFGAAFIDPDGLEFARLVIVEFVADGTTRVFDASDCSTPG